MIIDQQPKKFALILNLAFTISILSFLLGLALSLASILSPEWVSFVDKQQSYEYNFFECTNCPSEYDGTTFSCLQHNSCKSSESDLCNKAKNLQSGHVVIIAFEIITTILVVLLLERLIFILFRKGFGKIKFLYFLAISIGILRLVEFATYAGLTSVVFSSDCDNTENICSEKGLRFLLASFLATSSGSVFVIILLKLKSLKLEENRELDGTEYYRPWFYGKILPVMLIGAGFLGASLGWSWFFYYNIDKQYGTLTYMKDIDGWENKDFSCITGPACGSSTHYASEERFCTAITRAKNAGYIYSWLIYISFMCFCLWMENLIYIVLRKQFGFSETNFLWPPLCVLFGLIAILNWFSISEASYNGSCKVEAGDEDISFCVDQGATFSMISTMCLFLAGILYCVIYCQMKSDKAAARQIFPRGSLSMNKKVLDGNPTCGKTLDESQDDFRNSTFYDESPSKLERPSTTDTVETEGNPAIIVQELDNITRESTPLSCRNNIDEIVKPRHKKRGNKSYKGSFGGLEKN